MRPFKHDWHLKLLALSLAILVHVLVRKEQDRVRVSLELPVEISAPTGQRVVEPPPGTRVRVDLEGPAEAMRAIKNQDVRLALDTSGVKTGERTEVPVGVELAREYRGRVSIDDWRPRTLAVRVVSDMSRRLRVILKPVNRPDGWAIREPPEARPLEVTVSGTAEAVSRVASLTAAFALEPSERIDTLATIQALDAGGAVITDQVRLDPAQVAVTGLQERVVMQKRVPVQPVFRAPPGARLQVDVIPATVRIVGPEAAVGAVYVVETEPFALGSLQGRAFSRDVSVLPPRTDVEIIPYRVRVNVRAVPRPPR